MIEQVTSVTKPSSSVVISTSGLSGTFSDMGMTSEGDWSYEYTKWFIKMSDSGTFKSSVSGVSITLSVIISLDATEHPTISTTGCSCSISSVSVKLSGGASFIYNMVIGFFENRIKTELQTRICETATKVINGKVNNQLAAFPLQIVVAGDWILNLGFLSPPEFQTGYVDTKHKGAFTHKYQPSDPPIMVRKCL